MTRALLYCCMAGGHRNCHVSVCVSKIDPWLLCSTSRAVVLVVLHAADLEGTQKLIISYFYLTRLASSETLKKEEDLKK